MPVAPPHRPPPPSPSPRAEAFAALHARTGALQQDAALWEQDRTETDGDNSEKAKQLDLLQRVASRKAAMLHAMADALASMTTDGTLEELRELPIHLLAETVKQTTCNPQALEAAELARLAAAKQQQQQQLLLRGGVRSQPGSARTSKESAGTGVHRLAPRRPIKCP